MGSSAADLEQGLEKVWPPQGSQDASTVDIIAIHGLGTHSPLTWVSKVPVEGGGTKEVNWLSDPDMLPSIVPSARVSFFKWNAQYYERAPVIRVLDVGQVLLEHLRLERDQSNGQSRPLIFVASCFGGLVVTQALASAGRRDSPYYSILTATCGIIFLASPLQGTRAAQAAQWRIMLSGMLGDQVSDTLVEDLDGHTSKLREVTDAFVHAVRDGSMETKIVCFYETRSTQILNAILPKSLASMIQSTDYILVERDSATFLGVDAFPLNVSHVMVNKYRGPDDPHFGLVSGAIKDMVSEAYPRVSAQRAMTGEKRCVEVLPLQTVSNYTDRPSLSEELATKLHVRHPDRNPPHALAVTGLAGCGKTQVTLRYIECHKQLYNSIFWVDASSAVNALNSFQEIADTLKLPTSGEKADKDIWTTDTVRNVMRWLKDAPLKWLVIIDSADDPEWGVRNLVPLGTSGSVIITSQLKGANDFYGKRSESIELYTMSATEAETLLLRNVESPALAEEERRAGREIIQLLGHLPLAIDLARAVIENSRHREQAARRYLNELRRKKDEVLERSGLSGMSQYQKTLVDVWNISINAVHAHSPSAANLLKFFSFMDPNAIQDEMWRLASEGLQQLRNAGRSDHIDIPEWLEAFLEYDESWCNSSYEHALEWLQAYSLVRPLTGEWPGVSIHSLVQWRSQKDITQAECRAWIGAVYLFQAAASLQLLDESVEFRRHMVIHLRFRAHTNPAPTIDEHDWILGRLYADEGWWEEAEKLQVDIVEKRTRRFGPDHLNTLTSIHNLATTYQNQGRWQEAEKLEVNVVEKRSSKLGPDHPKTLTSIHNLAATYQNQGRWQEAEMLEADVIEKSTSKLGPDHPKTLTSIHNLAAIYRSQGRWQEAEKLEVDVVEKSIRRLGPDHPETLTSIHNLAITYWNQGRWQEAEKLEVDVLEKSIRRLGPDHPETLTSMDSLAATYWKQGQWQEAEKLELDVIEKSTRRLGPNHPDTIARKANLATISESRG